MDFLLNPEERQLQQLARTFTAREIIPQAAQLDRSKAFPQAIYDQALALGLLNLTVPPTAARGWAVWRSPWSPRSCAGGVWASARR